MNQPSSELALELHSDAFEQASRCDVFYVTNSPYTEDFWVAHRPLDEPPHGLAHETLAPETRCQHIAHIDGVLLHARLEQSRERTITLEPKAPRERKSSRPRVLA